MRFKELFIKKRIDAKEHEEKGQHQLKRDLGSLQLTSIGIGAIIGAGIFVITGQAAALYSGPAIILSFIIAAIICVFAGLCYAELASLIPLSGGAYSYSYAALGECVAWLVGWSLTAQYLGALCTVAVGWSGYFVNFLKSLGIALPGAWTSAPIVYSTEIGWHLSGSFLNIPAIAICVVIGLFVSIGVRAAAQLTNIMVVVKLGTVLLFVIFGVAYINTDNWTPFLPENTGFFGEFGWSGVLRGAGLLFFAYNGFDVVATMAQETVNPQKDLPRGILGSLAICTLAYIAVALVLTGVASYTQLNVPDPMSVALNAMGPKFVWFSLFVKFAIITALASVILALFLAQSRVFFAMSRDGLLPKIFSRVHHKFKTPLFSTLISLGVGAIGAGLFPVDILSQLVSLAFLLILSIVCLGVLILRYTQPSAPRAFKVPFVPYIPLLGVLGCVGQMLVLPLVSWLQLLVWLGIGLCVYFAYGVRHSRVRNG